MHSWNGKKQKQKQKHEEVCLPTYSCKAVVLLPRFPPSPLQVVGLLGVQCFSTEMPGVILAFMIASIVKVDECQGHTPGDT